MGEGGGEWDGVGGGMVEGGGRGGRAKREGREKGGSGVEERWVCKGFIFLDGRC